MEEERGEGGGRGERGRRDGGKAEGGSGGGVLATDYSYSMQDAGLTWLLDVKPARSLQTTLQHQPLQTGRCRTDVRRCRTDVRSGQHVVYSPS